jgi:cytochrome c-type biogenesis protein CcmH
MKTKSIILTAFYLLLVAAVLVPDVKVFAQQPTPSDDQVNAIARQLYCPVCENTPLDVCPTTACHQWR